MYKHETTEDDKDDSDSDDDEIDVMEILEKFQKSVEYFEAIFEKCSVKCKHCDLKPKTLTV